MFKRAGSTLTRNLRLRQVHTHPSSTYTFQSPRRNGRAIAAASALVVGAALWYSTSQPIHNDVTEKEQPKLVLPNKPSDSEPIYSLVWGSNANKTLCPNFPGDDSLRTPTIAEWLNGIALRDLKLEQTHAACVDARGDVYQWGEGFFGKSLKGAHTPKITLKGKNIVQLQLTDDKLYALSASGKLYVLATDVLKQELSPRAPTSASDSWWSIGWKRSEDEIIDFAEISPAEPLGRRESIVSIAAGKNHLLALTSKGRVFAHPINKKANEYGQLGFRKFSISNPVSEIAKSNSHLHVDLIPKSLTDPYANSSRSARVSSSTEDDNNLSKIDDKNIRFCTNLFEIPALRGVEIAQIAAGGRSSFARNPDGRVLGWGANEYGQIGLGSDVALGTITVPTEVTLWRFVGRNIRSQCLEVAAGGDLTAFVVERKSDKGTSTTDLLVSGNGQYGGLGNNLYTNAQGNPTRVKTLSGLEQYNDSSRKLDPITPDQIAISPTGHVLLTMNSSTDSKGVGGKDLMVWGRNADYELGLGKRSNVVVPAPVQAFADQQRFMLTSRKAKEVKDMCGRVWKRGVNVKQQVATGYGNSVVYWKIDT